MSRRAIYPGSFDPLTNGHISIIRRGLRIFDSLVVAIATNPRKTPMFSVEERKAILLEALGGDERVEVDAFEGLLVDYCRQRGISVVLRGLRAVSDFEYELQMANMNRKLAPEVETLFMMTGEENFYISSKFVREVLHFGGDVSTMVPEAVLRRYREKQGGGTGP
ncbi:MAG: pantetheine-phosphate adenylyltransferase [Deltaproteobacteria bacterium]|nr:MAG: pantetheine-phosphate adenylyltransferase [Deltaproteobacteria bacterium]